MQGVRAIICCVPYICAHGAQLNFNILTPYIQPMSKIANKKGEKRLATPSSNDPEVGDLTLK
jgi:hypothetical protein